MKKEVNKHTPMRGTRPARFPETTGRPLPSPDPEKPPTKPATDAPVLVLTASGTSGGPRRDILVRSGAVGPGGEGFVLGRHASIVHAVADHPTISRRHARITRDGNVFYIEDLSSANGTWVNDNRLTVGTKVRIDTGDTVRLAGMDPLTVRPV